MAIRRNRRAAIARLSGLGVGLAGLSLASRRAGATDNSLQIDANNTGTNTTSLTTQLAGTAFVIQNPHPGTPGRAIALEARLGPATRPPFMPTTAAILGFNSGIPAENDTADGVVGQALGFTARGVVGITNHGVGVLGRATTRTQSGRGIGVSGESDLGSGLFGRGRYGIRAFGPTAGDFVSAPDGVGISVVGRVLLSQAQRVKVQAGDSYVEVTGQNAVRPESFILATAQGDSSVHVTGAQRANKRTIRIHLSAPAPAAGLWVGYLVLG